MKKQTMYHIEAAIRDFEEQEREAAWQERNEQIQLAWNYCPHDLKVVTMGSHRQLVYFEVDKTFDTRKAHFGKDFYLPIGRSEQGIIFSVECLAGNVLLVRTNLPADTLLQEVVMGFLPF